MRTPVLAAALCAAVLLVSGCGGDDDTGDSPTAGASSAVADESPTTDEGDASTPDPEAAIQAYFTAQREADAAAICALEDESYQAFKYGEAGQACLDDLANNTEQTVWADPIVIVSLDQSDAGVDAVLQPNASTPDQASITLVLSDDGAWQVTTFS